MFYFALIKINDEDGGFYVKTHHLISDAWNMSLIGNQVMDNYCSLIASQEISPEKEPSYIEFALNEQEYLKADKFIKDKEFWNKKFEQPIELTTLKARKSNTTSNKSKRRTFVTPVKFTQKLYSYCRENKSSVFSLFLSALSLYMNRVTGKEDMTFGSTVLNRSNFKEKNTVGMFISTVPIRIGMNEESNFRAFEQNISKEWMSILRHQKYPYDLLLKDVRDSHKTTDNLYDIMISYQNAKFTKDSHSEEYETRWHFNGYQSESLAIHINDREDDGHLIIDYDFLSDLFQVKEIEFIHQHILTLLWHAIDNPEKKISKIEMLSEREKQKVLYEFNNTDAEYPKDKVIHQLFEGQVKKTPDNMRPLKKCPQGIREKS